MQDRYKNWDNEARDSRDELVMSPLEGVSVWVSEVDFESMEAATAASEMTSTEPQT